MLGTLLLAISMAASAAPAAISAATTRPCNSECLDRLSASTDDYAFKRFQLALDKHDLGDALRASGGLLACGSQKGGLYQAVKDSITKINFNAFGDRSIPDMGHIVPPEFRNLGSVPLGGKLYMTKYLGLQYGYILGVAESAKSGWSSGKSESERAASERTYCAAAVTLADLVVAKASL